MMKLTLSISLCVSPSVWDADRDSPLPGEGQEGDHDHDPKVSPFPLTPALICPSALQRGIEFDGDREGEIARERQSWMEREQEKRET